MKGLVVVICAPSQGGKDYIVKHTMQDLEHVYDMTTTYATSYKIREPREDDAEHICCVQDARDIPVDESDQITATIFGTQKLVYDKKEIASKIANGEIVFIATASPELAKKVKKEFGRHSVVVFVKRQQVNQEIMLVEDLNRHGKKIPRVYSESNLPEYLVESGYATQEEIDSAQERIKKRMFWYEKMKSEYVEFVADREDGADYIFKNWYTLMGGSWNTTIDEKGRKEFAFLSIFLMQVLKENEQEDSDWREKPNFDWFDDEIRTKNIFTMVDEWKKYIEDKREKE